MRDRSAWRRADDWATTVAEAGSAATPAPEPPADERRASAGAIEALEAELADREQQLRAALARERDARLEVDHARQRLEREARKEVDRGRRDLVAAVIPVLDDLDRAIAAARASGTADALVTGVELVRNGFLDRLRAFGVERFDPTGERFDPARHEAVSIVAAREPGQTGLIVTTLHPGYAAGVETIRPAHVIVAGPDRRSLS
jgi:molecular chaperone GrpE